MTEHRRHVLDASAAFTTEGTVLLSLAHLEKSSDLRRLLRRALLQPGQLWIGVVATARERDRIIAALHDGVVDGTSHVLGRRRHRSTRKA